MNLTEKMKKVARRLENEHNEVRESLEHKGERGAELEEIVRKFLREFLPNFLGVGTGEIVTASEEVAKEGQVSNQIDTVIYDANDCPTFYQSENAQVFPNEGVYGVIEVKSQLDSSSLEDDIEKIARVKRMPKSAYYEKAIETDFGPLYGSHWDHFPTLGAIFASESMELKTVLEKIREINEDKDLELYEQVDLVYVLKRGLIGNFEYDLEDKHYDVSCRPTPSTIRAYTEDERSLLFFYILLMQHLAQANMNPIQLAPYGDLTDATMHFGNSFDDSKVLEWFSEADISEVDDSENSN